MFYDEIVVNNMSSLHQSGGYLYLVSYTERSIISVCCINSRQRENWQLQK